jgi:Response regulator containing CheY-like receiver, AAA-type ATPase, and DNA-binding domains
MKKKSGSGRKKRILLVDDDPAILEIFSLLLREAGYRVETAEHALAAMCAVVRARPDLVLADIRMPIVDGKGLVAELKSSVDTKEIPVVAITGYDGPGAQEAAYKAGYDGYLTKPVDVRKFPHQVAQFFVNGKAKRGPD